MIDTFEKDLFDAEADEVADKCSQTPLSSAVTAPVSNHEVALDARY